MMFTYAHRAVQNYTTIIAMALAVVIFLGALALQSPARAQEGIVLSAQNKITLQQLYAQLQALQRQLALLQRGGGGVSGCFIPTRVLAYGMSGSDVSALQQYLAQDPSLYPGGLVTGFFGPATQAGVQAFQVRHKIVMKGTPKGTGFGVVGPKTSAVFARLCSNPIPRPIPPVGGKIILENVEFDENPWNITDNDENDISFDVVNNTSKDERIDYTISFDADDSSDDEPNDVDDSITVRAGDTETITESFDKSDFDLGRYEVQVDIESDANDTTKTIVLNTVDVDIDADDLALTSLSFEDNWNTSTTATNEITFNIVNSFTKVQEVEYQIIVENASTGAKILNFESEVNVPKNGTKEVSKMLNKAQYPAGTYTVSVEIDQDDDVDEDKESNNDDSDTMVVTNVVAVKGVYKVYNASTTPQLFFTNPSITKADALANCKTRVAGHPNIWCTWNDVLLWGTEGKALYRAFKGDGIVPVEKKASVTRAVALSSCDALRTAGKATWCLWGTTLIRGVEPLGTYKAFYQNKTVPFFTKNNMTWRNSLKDCRAKDAATPKNVWCTWKDKIIHGKPTSEASLSDPDTGEEM